LPDGSIILFTNTLKTLPDPTQGWLDRYLWCDFFTDGDSC